MIEAVESEGEGTLLRHGVFESMTLKGEFVICESKDVPGAFAIFPVGERTVLRFRHCGPDCETGR
jgi:hypothetical protein